MQHSFETDRSEIRKSNGNFRVEIHTDRESENRKTRAKRPNGSETDRNEIRQSERN